MIEYYYLSPDNQRKGPFTLEALLAQQITMETLVWKNGLPQWVAAREIPEIAEQLEETPPPIPGQVPQPQAQNQSQSQTGPQPSAPLFCPPTYLVWSILATIFCCLPFGIVAIVYASQVERNFFNKNYAEAEKSSRYAKNWCLASVISSVVISVVFFILSFGLGIMGIAL